MDNKDNIVITIPIPDGYIFTHNRNKIRFKHCVLLCQLIYYEKYNHNCVLECDNLVNILNTQK